MKKIYIDIGNKNLKIYKENGKLFRLKNTKDNKVVENLKTIVSFENYFIISSVDNEVKKIIEDYFVKNNIKYYFFTNKDYPLFFKNYNVDLMSLGEDRAVNIIARQEIDENEIIIDFGTALTIDVVSKNKYETGYIYPGIDILKNGLVNGTSKINDFEISNIHEGPLLTTNTQINDALILGYFGLIQILLEEISKQVNIKSYTLILTGGTFEQLYNLLGKEKFDFYIKKGYEKIDNLNYLGLKKAYEVIKNNGG